MIRVKTIKASPENLDKCINIFLKEFEEDEDLSNYEIKLVDIKPLPNLEGIIMQVLVIYSIELKNQQVKQQLPPKPQEPRSDDGSRGGKLPKFNMRKAIWP